MTESFDLVVLGTGTGGGIPARACREAGWSVANVEAFTPGGTCAVKGCDAKKPLVNASDIVAAFGRLKGKGLAGNAAIDWPELIAFKNTFTDPIPDRERRHLAEAGMPLVEATPRFADPSTIVAGDRTLAFDKCLIATGMIPRPLDFPGADLMVTSDAFLELAALPGEIVFVGGGYISMEFAHVAARCGASVTVVEMTERILPPFDPDMTDLLTEASRAAGIRIVTESCISAIERRGGRMAAACLKTGDRFEADTIVHGAGRVPSLEGMALEAGGVSHSKGGVDVNEFMQNPGNDNVYAVGDCAASDGLPLTPVANYEARIAADNMLHGNRRTADYTGIPSVVFTDPPLAAVGLTAPEAEERNMDVEVRFETMGDRKALRRLNIDHAGTKLLVDRGSDRIVGAHILGPGSGEAINAFAMAMRLGLTVSQLRDVIWTYPTLTATLIGGVL